MSAQTIEERLAEAVRMAEANIVYRDGNLLNAIDRYGTLRELQGRWKAHSGESEWALMQEIELVLGEQP